MDDFDKLIAAVEAGSIARHDLDTFIRWLGLDRPTNATAYATYKGSLDAAKRLHDALVPGWAWDVCDDGEAKVWEYVDRFYPPEFVGVCRDNPARAWFLAILRARKACFSDCKP